MGLHSGVWTIVFTDLVGSTAQRLRLGDARGDELRREHDEIVARAVQAHEGVVVKKTGDGAMCAFVSTVAALEAATKIAQGFDRFNQRSRDTLEVRVGLSLGEVAHEADDLHGLAVNEAARLCALANPGQVVASDLVRAVAGSRSEHGFTPLGAFELKGLPAPVVVWQVDWTPTRPPQPALLTAEQAMTFCGRDQELGAGLAALEAALGGERRGLFIVGEAGIGKTRLTTEIARSCGSARRGRALRPL